MPRVNLYQSFVFSLLVLLIISFFISCKNDRLDVDISRQNVDLTYKRLDENLRTISPDEMKSKHLDIASEYGELYQDFVEIMLREGPIYGANTAEGMSKFVGNEDIQSVLEAIHHQFPNKEFNQKEFEDAFKHYSYYFPKDTVPEIVGFYSNFNARALFYSNTLAIGLEMYLGPDHEIIKRIPSNNLPQYFKDKTHSDYLVSDAMKIFLNEKHGKTIGEDFLSNIISLGKIMYLLDACMPNAENWKKMTYTPKEIEWCEENEEQIWAYIVNEKILFSVEQEKINNFITVAPNTKGLPADSPDRVGVWIGWQMVRDYMNENPEVSVKELIEESNPKRILKHYKPS